MYSALTSSATVRSLTTTEEVELPPTLLRLEAVAALGKRRNAVGIQLKIFHHPES
jgi:hypothetical protein